MLLIFRRMADGVIAKAILALIVLSFGIWGVGDIFKGGRDYTVAQIGSRKMTISELKPLVEREIAQARRMAGSNAVPEMMQQMLMEDVLRRTIQRELLLQEARALGVTVSDRELAEYVSKNPAFQDSKGQFSKEQFKNQLRHLGLHEKVFMQSERDDLIIQSFVRGVVPGGSLPQMTLLHMLQRQSERMQVEVVTVPLATIKDVPTPTDTDLVEFYENHKDRYTSPETREVAYLTIDRAAFANQASVSDADVTAEYETRKDEFSSEPVLELQQLIARSKEDALKAQSELKNKADFVKVAKTYGTQEASAVNLSIKPSELFDDAARAAIAKLSAGEATEPLESPMGWHIYKLIKRGKTESVSEAEARKKIAAELKAQKADELLFEAIDKMEDAAAGGASVDDIAKEFGGTVHQAGPVTREGNAPDGSKAQLPELKDFLKTVFATDEGKVSSFIEHGDGKIYAVQVKTVKQARERALDEVRGLVTAAWQKEKQQSTLKDKATRAAEAMAGGTAAAEALKAQALAGSVTTITVDPAKPESFEKLPSAIVTALQRVDIGKLTPVAVTKDGAAVWARLVSVTPSTLTADSQDFKNVEPIFGQVATSEQLDELLAYLERKHGLTVYEDRLPRPATQDE